MSSDDVLYVKLKIYKWIIVEFNIYTKMWKAKLIAQMFIYV